MIERFDWTNHAESRVRERNLERILVEMTVKLGHDGRGRNDGRADWRVRGRRFDGRRFVVIYDHPVANDVGRVRLVSVWDLPEGSI
ncbi:MAG TPA: DUF4258 domain-containing protein [Solirubrobacterales bacterium]|nr:DUF4258 domain-containing protein [Solirubrobacterales bacterium]